VTGNLTPGLRRGDDGKWQIATDMWTETLFGSGFTLAVQPEP
jgi:ketosteroid isomerase-like protein